MGFSIGVGIGPLRYSQRISGGNSKSGSNDDEGAFLLVVGGVWLGLILMSRAPEWAWEATTGEWGVTVFFLGVLGLTFLCIGPFVPLVGTVPVLSWLMFIIYRFNWWKFSQNALGDVSNGMIDRPWDSVDHYVLNVIGALAWIVVGVLLLLPLVIAAVAAVVVNQVLGRVLFPSAFSELEQQDDTDLDERDVARAKWGLAVLVLALLLFPTALSLARWPF